MHANNAQARDTSSLGSFEIDTLHAHQTHAHIACFSEKQTTQSLFAVIVTCASWHPENVCTKFTYDSKCKYFNCLSFDFEPFVQCGATRTTASNTARTPNSGNLTHIYIHFVSCVSECVCLRSPLNYMNFHWVWRILIVCNWNKMPVAGRSLTSRNIRWSPWPKIQNGAHLTVVRDRRLPEKRNLQNVRWISKFWANAQMFGCCSVLTKINLWIFQLFACLWHDASSRLRRPRFVCTVFDSFAHF